MTSRDCALAAIAILLVPVAALSQQLPVNPWARLAQKTKGLLTAPSNTRGRPAVRDRNVQRASWAEPTDDQPHPPGQPPRQAAANKPRATTARAKSRPIPAQGRPQRTVSQYMAQERP